MRRVFCGHRALLLSIRLQSLLRMPVLASALVLAPSGIRWLALRHLRVPIHACRVNASTRPCARCHSNSHHHPTPALTSLVFTCRVDPAFVEITSGNLSVVRCFSGAVTSLDAERCSDLQTVVGPQVPLPDLIKLEVWMDATRAELSPRVQQQGAAARWRCSQKYVDTGT